MIIVSDKGNAENTATSGETKSSVYIDWSLFMNFAVKSTLTSLAITLACAPLNLASGYVLRKEAFEFLPFFKNLCGILPSSAAGGQIKGAVTHVTKHATSASEGKYVESAEASLDETWAQKPKVNLASIAGNKVFQTGVFSQLGLLSTGYFDNKVDLKTHKIEFDKSLLNRWRVLKAGYPISSLSRFVGLYMATQSREITNKFLPENLFADCQIARNLLGGAVVGTGMSALNYPLSVAHFSLLGKAVVKPDKHIQFMTSAGFFKSIYADVNKVGLPKSTKEFLSTAIKVLPMRTLNSIITIVVLDTMSDLLGDKPVDNALKRFK